MKNGFGTAVLILSTISIISIINAEESASFEDQPQLHSRRSIPSKSNKPKKYKCVLVDEDDESSQNGAISYVSELQQRRLQAANFVEKTQTESHRVATPTLTRPYNPKHAQPIRVASTNNNQYTRTSSFALPRAEEPSVAGLKNKPLKQITLNRAQETATNYQPPPPPQTIVHSTTAAPMPSNMRLSQEYCNMIKHYAALYNVQDVVGWVSKNCAFAKTYLPNATCQEINMLVASCYRFFKQ